MAKGLHDFDMQRQGPDNKKKLKVKLVFNNHTDDREFSLYRPHTKNVDPRFWIGHLGEYADQFNLIAIFVDSIGTIFVVNCSRSNIWTSKDRLVTPFHQILNEALTSDIAEELLNELTGLSAWGSWIRGEMVRSAMASRWSNSLASVQIQIEHRTTKELNCGQGCFASSAWSLVKEPELFWKFIRGKPFFELPKC
jgi:hypothetical protein